MLKVAFFADILSRDFDGASRTMYQIISRINEDTHDYLFITGHDKMEGQDQEKLSIIETPNMSIPLQKRYKMSVPFLQSKKLSRQLDEFKPEVVHISTPSLLGRWAIKYARQNNIPVISIFHTYFSSYMQYYFKFFPWLGRQIRKITDRYQRWFYNNCDLIYAPSKSMKEELVSIGVDPSKIDIWERGINRTLFNPENRDLEYIKGITNNDKTNVLFVSRLVWEKNLQVLIDIYKKDSDHKFNFIIAGEGHARSNMEKNMPTAIFLGDLTHNELSKLYASADILCFPSISETFGNVVLESLCSGTPAIVADQGGTKDMIEDGYNGYICEANNASEYLNRIHDLIEDKAFYQTMRKQALESTSKYNWSDLTTRYFNDVDTLTKLNIEQS